jgi:hypothetical protein
MATDEFALKVWRLHPNGCPIVPAERTLSGTANKDAVRFCGPFTHANQAGWWVFPPVDVDITWRGGRQFEWEILTPYTDADDHLIRFLIEDGDEVTPGEWLTTEGRTKFTFGLLEEGVVQIWTGCIFEVPTGWALQLRSPINFPRRPCYVMEAMIEADWLQYDIWLNLAFDRPNETVQLRREGWPPIAQLVPVHKETYDALWGLETELVNRNSEDANRVFEFYIQYNQRKFASGGKQRRSYEDPTLLKDSATYYKERKRRARGTPSG